MTDIFFGSEPNLTPAQLAAAIGMSPDTQRDWRRRDYIPKGIGTQQENGRWLYDWMDAAYLWMVRELVSHNFEVVEAQSVTGTILGYVVIAAQYQRGLVADPPSHRYFSAFKDSSEAAKAFGGRAMQPISDLSHLRGPAGKWIDVYEIAKIMPPSFDEHLRMARDLILNDMAESLDVEDDDDDLKGLI